MYTQTSEAPSPAHTENSCLDASPLLSSSSVSDYTRSVQRHPAEKRVWKVNTHPLQDKRSFERKLGFNSLFKRLNNENHSHKASSPSENALNITDSFRYRVEGLLDECDYIIASDLKSQINSPKYRSRVAFEDIDSVGCCHTKETIDDLLLSKPRFRRKSDTSSWSGGVSKFEAKTVLLTCQVLPKKTEKKVGDKRRIMTTFEARTRFENSKSPRSFTTINGRGNFGGKKLTVMPDRSQRRPSFLAATMIRSINTPDKLESSRQRKSFIGTELQVNADFLRISRETRENTKGPSLNTSPDDVRETESTGNEEEDDVDHTQTTIKALKKTHHPTKSSPITEALKVKSPLIASSVITLGSPIRNRNVHSPRQLTVLPGSPEQKLSSFFYRSEAQTQKIEQRGRASPKMKRLTVMKQLKNETIRDVYTCHNVIKNLDQVQLVPLEGGKLLKKQEQAEGATPSRKKRNQRKKTYCSGFGSVRDSEIKKNKIRHDPYQLSSQPPESKTVETVRLATSPDESAVLRSHRKLRMNTEIPQAKSYLESSRRKISDHQSPYDSITGQKSPVLRHTSLPKIFSKEMTPKKEKKSAGVREPVKIRKILRTYSSVISKNTCK